MPIDWGQVISSGISTVGKYLTSRDQEQTARTVAKYQAGQGMGIESIMSLITLGQSMGGARQVMPQPAYDPRYQIQRPGTGLGPLQTTPLPLPYPTDRNPLAQIQGGSQMAVPAIYTPPYQQTAGIMDLAPYAGEAWNWMTGGGNGSMGDMVEMPGAFQQGTAGVRAKSRLIMRNPQSGNLVFYKNMGQPVLYSGDLAACKRVNRVARRARRASPRRPAIRRKR